ncbi:MAG: GAF domain-containing protein [Thiobacillaceae bacterium]
MELARLQALIAFEPAGSFDASLAALAAHVAELLAAGRVSIMLRDIGQAGRPALKLVALHGAPLAGWRSLPPQLDGIANRVLATERSLLVEDIRLSEYADLARHGSGSFLACPLVIAEKPAGVLNASEPVDRPAFAETDLALAETAALLVARVIQMMRLTQVLDSRFTQMALALEGGGDCANMTRLSAHEPERVAKLLAKAFYREMHRCGFTPNQIIHAAGEIISELTESLNRHRQRIARKG